MIALFLPAVLALAQAAEPQPAPAPAPVPAATPAREAKPLSFASFKLPFTWNAVIPIKGVEVDGLQITSIYFNKREPKVWPLKGADFGTRARVQVTNTAAKERVPGFAVAVFDGEDRLIGVASGGTKFGSVKPGRTEDFDLSFHQVLERLPKGAYFYLSVELSE